MANNMADDKNIIKKYVENDFDIETDNDGILKSKTKFVNLQKRHDEIIIEHSQKYNDILEAYQKNVSKTLAMKRVFKIVFFIFSIVSLIFALGIFSVICYSVFKHLGDGKGYNWTIVATLLSSLVSIITMYNVIPEIIAKYLFNIEEDKNMTKFVENIQSYDSNLIDVIDKRQGESAFAEEGLRAS